MLSLWRAFVAGWDYLRDNSVRMRTMVFVAAVFSVVFFLLGGMFHPQKHMRDMANDLQDAREDARRYADKLAQQHDTVKKLRAQLALRDNTLQSLERRLGELDAGNLLAREENLFFQRLFNSQAAENELSVFALEVVPDFAPRQWQLNAVLVRAGKKKSYKGGYFFEVLLADKDGEEISRVPAEARPFEMGFYYEITETFALPRGKEIKNIRLTVVDQKQKIVASGELPQTLDADSADG